MSAVRAPMTVQERRLLIKLSRKHCHRDTDRNAPHTMTFSRRMKFIQIMKLVATIGRGDGQLVTLLIIKSNEPKPRDPLMANVLAALINMDQPAFIQDSFESGRHQARLTLLNC